MLFKWLFKEKERKEKKGKEKKRKEKSALEDYYLFFLYLFICDFSFLVRLIESKLVGRSVPLSPTGL